MPSKKKATDDKALPMVECECGAKILLKPDVKKMSRTIEAHIQTHIKNLKLSKEDTDLEEDRIRNHLIKLILQKACET